MYKDDSEIKLPKSVIERKDREAALATLKKGVGDAVAEIEKPLEKIVTNLAKDSTEKRKFENSVVKSVEGLNNHVKTQDKKINDLVEKQTNHFSAMMELIKTQHEEIKKHNSEDKEVRINNIEDIVIPPVPKKIKTEFIEKQEIYGTVDTGLVIPKVQVVKFEKEPKPPVVNVIEKVIEFPPVQKVELKNKIKPPVIKVTEKKVVFPKVQKVEFKKIPTVKIHNPQKEVRIKNLKDLKLELPEKLKIDNLPIARGHKPSVKKADPGIYIPVRLTDGNGFIGGFGGGGTTMGGGASSLPEAWISASGTVGVTSSLIVAAHSLRKSASITNDSVNVVYLSFGEDARIGAGARLNELGGSYEIDRNNLYKGNVFAISTGVNSNVSLLVVNKTLD